MSTLSQAGRICLAESSVMSIPSYIIQTNKIPASTCDEIERLCRDFIWGSTPEVRKHHLISWARICTPKYEGGLGFRGLRMVNSAFLMKLGWNIMAMKEALYMGPGVTL